MPTKKTHAHPTSCPNPPAHTNKHVHAHICTLCAPAATYLLSPLVLRSFGLPTGWRSSDATRISPGTTSSESTSSSESSRSSRVAGTSLTPSARPVPLPPQPRRKAAPVARRAGRELERARSGWIGSGRRRQRQRRQRLGAAEGRSWTRIGKLWTLGTPALVDFVSMGWLCVFVLRSRCLREQWWGTLGPNSMPGSNDFCMLS